MPDIQQWKGRLAVSGLGLVTPVGLTAPASIAAMRAGISRIADLPGMEIAGPDGSPQAATGAQVPVVPQGRQGVARLIRLAGTALMEAVSDASVTSRVPCAIYLGTPATNPARRVLEFGRALSEGLRGYLPSTIATAEIKLFEEGRAAALTAMRQAAAEVTEKRVTLAIVGGVDSWVGPRSLSFLRATGRLREGPKSSGILPGEAAGFVILEDLDGAVKRNATIKAEFLAAYGAREPASPGEPCTALAFGSVLIAACGEIPERAPALTISDLNGERHRAYEWMFGASRAYGHAKEPFRHWHPAEYIGDAGAGSGAVACVWAATALLRGYARTDRVLICGASDEGAREALIFGSHAGG